MKHQIEAAVCIIESPDNKILILERNDKRLSGWCLPGGKIDVGESNMEGVIREVREESGITRIRPVYLGPCKSINGLTVHVYYATVNDKKVTISGEHLSYEWVGSKVTSQAVHIGLPVIYTNSGGVSELVNGNGICINDYNVIDFVDTVPDLDSTKLFGAYKYIKKNYDSFVGIKPINYSITIKKYFDEILSTVI